MKDFNEQEHAVCPLCGFEVIHYNAEEHVISYLFKDGSVDEETSSVEEIEKDEHNKVECNSRHCNYVK
ncbi:hypothetical protein D3C76_00890 [compost metagenome]